MDVFEDEWDFFEKCRTCRKTGELRSATDESEKSLTLNKMLQTCTFITISESDELPDQICTNCCDELERAYKFVTKCEESERKIQNYIDELVTKKRNEDYLKRGLERSFRSKRTIGRYRLKVKEYLLTEKLKYKRYQLAINEPDNTTIVNLTSNNETSEASGNISADFVKKYGIKAEPFDVDDVGSLAADNIADLPTLEQENAPTEAQEVVPTLKHGNLPTSDRETLPTSEQTVLPTVEQENNTNLPIDVAGSSVLGSNPLEISKIDQNLINSRNTTVFIKNEVHQFESEGLPTAPAPKTTNMDENTRQDGLNFNFTPVDVPMRLDEIKLEATDAIDEEDSTQDTDEVKKSTTTTNKTQGKIVKLKIPINASSKLSTVIKKLSNSRRNSKLKLLINSTDLNNEGEQLQKKLSNSKLIPIGKQQTEEQSKPVNLSVDYTNCTLSSLIQYNFSSLIPNEEQKPSKSKKVKEKLFKCEQCYKTFTRLHYLTAHVTYVHELNRPRPQVRKKFQCARCLVIFFNEKLLDAHMRKHHGHIMTRLRRRDTDEKPFRCVVENSTHTIV